MAAISLPPQRVVCDASNKPASSATAFELSATGVTGFLLPFDAQSEVVSGNSYDWLAEEIDASGNPSGAWQTWSGVATDAATDTISQDTLIASSTGSFIDWSATGVNASPRISAIDLPQRHQNAVEVWDGTGSPTTIQTPTFTAGSTYLIIFDEIKINTDSRTLRMLAHVSGGSDSTNTVRSAYHYVHGGDGTGTSYGKVSLTGLFPLSYAASLGNATGEAQSSFAWVKNPAGSGRTSVRAFTEIDFSGGTNNFVDESVTGRMLTDEAHDYMTIKLSGSGTFSSGRIYMIEYPTGAA